MQTLLNLDDYGYESSDAGETIRNCKKEQRGYDIRSHSGMDMMRFYKRLLEQYKDALGTEINRLESMKNDVDRMCSKKYDASAGLALGVCGAALLEPSEVFSLAALFGLGPAAVGRHASRIVGDEETELRERSDEYQSKIDKVREYIRKIEGIESKYKLSQV